MAVFKNAPTRLRWVGVSFVCQQYGTGPGRAQSARVSPRQITKNGLISELALEPQTADHVQTSARPVSVAHGAALVLSVANKELSCVFSFVSPLGS